MKVELIRIGNSKGIRIPKPVIEQCGFGDTVDLKIRNMTVVISPTTTRRAGWDEAFAAMAERGDDAPLLDERATEWDEHEWTW